MLQAFEVIGGLGQTHYTRQRQSSPITNAEIVSELTGRGYSAAEHVPVEHEVLPVLTRSLSISIAVDVTIDQYNAQLRAKGMSQISRTSTHFYRCVSSCQIDPGLWRGMLTWATMLANGYLSNQYTIPYWAVDFLPPGTTHGLALPGLGDSGLGGFADWAAEHPYVFAALGAVFAAYGQYLTAKQVENAIKENIPQDVLKKEDMAAIIAALQQSGVIPPGQEGTVAAGVKAATGPSWMWPVAIAGGIVVGALLLFRR